MNLVSDWSVFLSKHGPRIVDFDEIVFMFDQLSSRNAL